MAMQIMDCTPEILDEVVTVISGETQKEAARQIARLFMEAGLTVKAKRHIMPQYGIVFRLECYIKKSKEAVILNTDGFDFDGMSAQVRIANPDSLTQLDALSANIRMQILNGNNCRFCGDKCDGKRYQFTHDGASYVKCHMLCSNFRFQVATEADVNSVLALIKREIIFAANKKKK